MHRRKFLETSIVATSLASIANATTQTRLNYGMNLAPLYYWETSNTFNDLMYAAQPFENVVTDAAGWPLAPSTTSVANGANILPGDYLIKSDGTGDFIWDCGPQKFRCSADQVYAVTLNQSPKNTFLKVLNTDSADHLRNIQILRSLAQTSFNPDWLQSVRHFRVLRFMEWLRINNSNVVEFDQLNWNSFTNATDNGVNLNFIIELCNSRGHAAWINIPDQASDDFVIKFLTFFKENLNADIPIYLEFSNELWNSQFKQHKRAVTVGASLNNDPVKGATIFLGQRIAAIFATARRILAGRDLKCVVGGQCGNPWWFQNIVANMGSEMPDCIAVAPYFFSFKYYGEDLLLADYARKPARALNQIFQGCKTHINTTLSAQMAQNAQICQQLGCELLCYEGGQSLVSKNLNVMPIYVEFNKTIEMGNLHKIYKSMLMNYPIELFCWYDSFSVFGNFGSWGAKEGLYSPDLPKSTVILG